MDCYHVYNTERKAISCLFSFKIKSQFEDMLMVPLIQKKLLNPPSQRAVGEKKDLVVLVPRQRQKNKLRRMLKILSIRETKKQGNIRLLSKKGVKTLEY